MNKENFVEFLKEMEDQLTTYSKELYQWKYANEDELTHEASTALGNARQDIINARHRIRDLVSEFEQRIYLIQVTTTVDTNIKVLAKNEDDAIEWACTTADERIRKTLAREHDVYYDSTGEVLGDESQSDDEPDEEYQYDD